MKLNTIISDLLKKAIKPSQVKYTLLHDTKATKKEGKGYKIVCQSPKLPISKKEILELSDEQAKLLDTILKYRKLEKSISKYEKSFEQNYNKKQ